MNALESFMHVIVCISDVCTITDSFTFDRPFSVRLHLDWIHISLSIYYLYSFNIANKQSSVFYFCKLIRIILRLFNQSFRSLLELNELSRNLSEFLISKCKEKSDRLCLSLSDISGCGRKLLYAFRYPGSNFSNFMN